MFESSHVAEASRVVRRWRNRDFVGFLSAWHTCFVVVVIMEKVDVMICGFATRGGCDSWVLLVDMSMYLTSMTVVEWERSGPTTYRKIMTSVVVSAEICPTLTVSRIGTARLLKTCGSLTKVSEPLRLRTCAESWQPDMLFCCFTDTYFPKSSLSRSSQIESS